METPVDGLQARVNEAATRLDAAVKKPREEGEIRQAADELEELLLLQIDNLKRQQQEDA